MRAVPIRRRSISWNATCGGTRVPLRGWRLGQVVTVVDHWFSSDANLDYLRRAGGHWIAGERMRDGSADAAEGLARQGRYQSVRDNLRVKEVRLASSSDRRGIVCHCWRSKTTWPRRCT